MMRFIIHGFVLTLLAALAPAAAHAQLDSPVGMSPALLKLFSTSPPFTAKADVRLLDNARKEVMRMPMDFAMLNDKLRVDLDAGQISGPTVRPDALAPYKKLGMDRMTSVIRPDQKLYYIVFPGCHSYLQIPFETNDVEAIQKGLLLQKTAAGRETVDGRPCVRNSVVIKSARGEPLINATSWNSPDLKDFPVQIAMASNQGTIVLHFKSVQLNRPSAAQFEPPKNFAKFHSQQALVMARTSKAGPAATKK